MPTRREVFKNNAFTTLAGSIDSSVTSLSVLDGTVFPGTGEFRVLIDSEIMLCTARAGNTLTVQRGQEGTLAASHSDGAVVVLALTASALARFGRDNDPYHDSSRPPLGRILDANGNLITSAGFTVVNAGAATILDQDSTAVLRKPAQGAVEDVTILVRAAPSPPYNVVAAMRFNYPCGASGSVPNGGVGFRESSTGKLFVLAYNAHALTDSHLVSVYQFSSPTVFASNVVARTTWGLASDIVWLRVEDDNTNLKFYVSADGFNWILIHSAARTAFMASGPDQVGWYSNNYNNTFEALATLVHWSEG